MLRDLSRVCGIICREAWQSQGRARLSGGSREGSVWRGCARELRPGAQGVGFWGAVTAQGWRTHRPPWLFCL